MENKLINFLSYILTLYIASLIIFKMHYINIPHFLNLLLIFIFFFISIIRKEYIYSVNNIIIAYALFVVFAFATSFWGLGFTESSFRSAQLFLILINIFLIYNIIKQYNLLNTFLNGILLGAFVNFIFVLGIVPAPFPIIDINGLRYFGTLGNPNTLSLIMVTSMLSSMIYLRRAEKINKILYYYQYFNILISMYIIFLTVSKKGIFAGTLLLSIFIFLNMKTPKNFFKLAFFIGIGATILLNYVNLDDFFTFYDRIIHRFTAMQTSLSSGNNLGTSTGERMYFIELGLKYFTEKPLIGYGINNFNMVARTYSHNNYVELLFGVGLIGTLIFYSIYFQLFKIVFFMKDYYLKVIFIAYILILLILDMANVSYGSKILLYTLIYLYILAENDYYRNTKKI